jgi:hypothetical protein
MVKYNNQDNAIATGCLRLVPRSGTRSSTLGASKLMQNIPKEVAQCNTTCSWLASQKSDASMKVSGARVLARIGWGLSSLTLGLCICVGTGLIPKWGQWYSVNMAYRRQTESFLRGVLALDSDPRKLGYDMAWAEGGVQQVWGLGVPSWRLPFEFLAKLTGQEAFPDRLALAGAITLVIYVLLNLAAPLSKPERLAGALLVILFPPFLTLCHTHFDVYEEAQTYMYLTGIALFAATLGFVRQPTIRRYAVLGLLSGLAAFVRPTLLCYGLASVLLAWLLTRRENWPRDRQWVGPVLFGLGCGLLFLTNYLRFGSGLEFGHRLNVNVNVPMMYATRFDNPVAAGRLLPRITELFSYLFLARAEIHCCDGYLSGIVPGEAPVIRWRDIYFSTYDLSFLAMIMIAWLTSFLLWWRGPAMTFPARTEIATIGAWSFLAAAPLVILYLYYPVMSSRYMMDFAPAFAVAVWILIQLGGWLVRRAYLSGRVLRSPSYLTYVLGLTFGGWWVYQVSTARIFAETGGGVVQAPLRRASVQASNLPLDLVEYSAGTDKIGSQIPLNGYGWDQSTGRTDAMVVLFLNDADGVELELGPLDGVPLDQDDWEQVRVKIGLQLLMLENSSESNGGRRLTFRRPSIRSDHQRIEVAFIALARPEDSLDASKFQLTHVRVLGRNNVQR